MINEISTTGTSLLILIHVSSSVMYALVSKYIYYDYFVDNVATITAFNLIVYSIGLWICVYLNYITFTHLPLLHIAHLSSVCAIYYLYMNLSLWDNTIGTYQLMKLSGIPLSIAVDYYMKGKSVSRSIKTAITVLCLGMVTVICTEKFLTYHGIYYAIAEVCSKLYYETMMDNYQLWFQCSRMQLSLYSISGAALIMTVFSQYMDCEEIRIMSMTWKVKVMVIYAALLLFTSKMSAHQMLETLSLRECSVVRQIKICLLYMLDSIVNFYEFRWTTVIGIIITITGATMCSRGKTQEYTFLYQNTKQVTL